MQKQKYKSECIFPSDERLYNGSGVSRGDFFWAVTSLLAVQAMELVREIPPAVDYNETRPRSICAGNFLSDIVTNFLFRTSCGQRRSIVKELMFLLNLFF